MPPQLRRGRPFVAADGTMLGARLQRMNKREDRSGKWPWKYSRFDRSRELNGLRGFSQNTELLISRQRKNCRAADLRIERHLSGRRTPDLHISSSGHLTRGSR